jgi:hypothetical protein
VGAVGQAVDVFRDTRGRKRFIGFGNAEIRMGWVIHGKESIEKSPKLAFADKTDVANFYGGIKPPWAWLP